MTRYELDRVYLNHIRTNNIEVIVTTDEHTADGEPNYFSAYVVAFSPSVLVLSVKTEHGYTQCLVYCKHVVSIIPKQTVNIIFDNSKGD